MKSLIIIIFLCIVLAISFSTGPDCPSPLVYTPICPECQPTCDNPNPNCPFVYCKRDCRCMRKNYRLDDIGDCVHVKKCPNISSTQCRKNEIYKKCGCIPIPTCDRPGFGACKAMCVPGCFCKAGYIRDDVGGKCIKPNKCPNHPICRKNMEFRCRRDCEPSCQHSCKVKDQELSPDDCRVPTCHCKKGFVKRRRGDVRSGCIKRSHCPYTEY